MLRVPWAGGLLLPPLLLLLFLLLPTPFLLLLALARPIPWAFGWVLRGWPCGPGLLLLPVLRLALLFLFLGLVLPFLPIPLTIGRNEGSEEKRQHSRTDEFACFHVSFLHDGYSMCPSCGIA